MILTDEHFLEQTFHSIFPNFFIFMQIFEDFVHFLTTFYTPSHLNNTPFIIFEIFSSPLLIDPSLKLATGEYQI